MKRSAETVYKCETCITAEEQYLMGDESYVKTD